MPKLYKSQIKSKLFAVSAKDGSMCLYTERRRSVSHISESITIVPRRRERRERKGRAAAALFADGMVARWL